jgi:hypothetical protein
MRSSARYWRSRVAVLFAAMNFISNAAAVVKRTRYPRVHIARPSALRMWLLPRPGGPLNIRLRWAATKAPSKCSSNLALGSSDCSETSKDSIVLSWKVCRAYSRSNAVFLALRCLERDEVRKIRKWFGVLAKETVVVAEHSGKVQSPEMHFEQGRRVHDAPSISCAVAYALKSGVQKSTRAAADSSF